MTKEGFSTYFDRSFYKQVTISKSICVIYDSTYIKRGVTSNIGRKDIECVRCPSLAWGDIS